MQTSKSPQYARFIGEEKKGETRILRHVKIGEKDELVKLPYEGCESILHGFEKNVEKLGNTRFLGTRRSLPDGKFGEYVWKTFKDAHSLGKDFSKGIMKLNLCPVVSGGGLDLRFLGIYAKNREEWIVTDLACMYNDITSVTFYDTLGAESTEFIIQQTELTTIACSGAYAKAITATKKKLQNPQILKNIILYDEISEADMEEATKAGLTLYRYADVIEQGKAVEAENFKKCGLDSIYTFSYTSGTTGVPKAAMLTHRSILADGASVLFQGVVFTPNDVHYSYLPLPHVFERMVCVVACYIHGAPMGFSQGDVLKMVDDLTALKPTFFVTVPRILNRIYSSIKSKIEQSGMVKRKMANYAVSTKLSNLKKNGGVTHAVWDRLVFNKMKALLGGNIKWIASASAPISPEVLEMLRICFCCPIIEAYGQTECCGGATMTYMHDYESGHVGGPLPVNDIKLVDVPEMGHFSTDQVNGVSMPRGEICYKGANVILGYYKAPDRTKEAIDEDGWLHSGDVGVILPNGAVKITDRKKNIFKLSQGEYIAPEKLENTYLKCPFVTQIFVYGDSLKDYLIALIVPDEKYVKNWLTTQSIAGVHDYSAALKSDELKKTVLTSLSQLARESKFNGLEIPKQIELLEEPFSVENGILTPTLKIKRHDAKLKYEENIKQLYSLAPISLK